MNMINRKTGAALAGALALAAMASQVHAQTAAAAPPIQTGPAIPGMCVLSREGLVGASTVGKYVQTRLSQLAQQADAEVTAQQTSLESDAKALDAQKASLSSDQLNDRAAALQGRQRDIERLVQVRRQEMSATQQKAVNRVLTEADPLVRQAFQQHNCTVLLDSQAVIFAAPAMDLTPGVIQALNARITQFAFEREHLDQSAAPAQ
jgi:Skp family chaperone for outer membrane proteins